MGRGPERGEVVAGASCRDAAKRFSTGVSSVVRWARRFRQTGSVAAKPMGGERNSRLKDERDWLLARVAASPDLPLHKIRRELTACNGTISSPRMSTPQQKPASGPAFVAALTIVSLRSGHTPADCLQFTCRRSPRLRSQHDGQELPERSRVRRIDQRPIRPGPSSNGQRAGSIRSFPRI